MISKLSGVVASDLSYWKDSLAQRAIFWSDRESSGPGCGRVYLWNHSSVPLVLPNPSFSLKVLGSLECEVGVCSCWTQDHGKSSSVRIKFQALWVAGSAQECDLWFLNLPNKLEGICLGTADPMTPRRSNSYLHAWDVSCQVLAWSLRMLSLRSAVCVCSSPVCKQAPHKVSFIRVAACPLHITFDFWVFTSSSHPYLCPANGAESRC